MPLTLVPSAKVGHLRDERPSAGPGFEDIKGAPDGALVEVALEQAAKSRGCGGGRATRAPFSFGVFGLQEQPGDAVIRAVLELEDVGEDHLAEGPAHEIQVGRVGDVELLKEGVVQGHFLGVLRGVRLDFLDDRVVEDRVEGENCQVTAICLSRSTVNVACLDRSKVFSS